MQEKALSTFSDSFVNCNTMESPILTHSVENSAECSSAEAVHLKIQTGENQRRTHSCHICNKTFGHCGTLNIHLRTHTGEKPHTCNVCNKSFTQSCSLKVHLLTHTGEKPHICNTCNKTFTQSSSLKSHLLTHTGEKPHVCYICNKSFAHVCNLKSHSLTHTEEAPHSCKICNKTFTYMGNLKSHLLTHTKIKPHTCNICNRSYTQAGSLKIHSRKHTDGDLSCDNKEAKNVNILMTDGKSDKTGALKSHLLAHTGDELYLCKICNKTLASNLQEHLLTHTDVEQHPCEICMKVYKYAHCLEKHVLMKHNVVFIKEESSLDDKNSVKLEQLSQEELVVKDELYSDDD